MHYCGYGEAVKTEADRLIPCGSSQMKQAAAEAPPEVLASPRPKQRALWRFRSGGQPAQYVPPADPVVKAAAAAPDRSSPKAAQQPSPKASLLSRKWSPPAPLIAPQPPSPAAGDVPKSPSALDNGCVMQCKTSCASVG